MRAVSTVRGKAIPLDRRNVDTDQIIPARHLKRVERTGYGEFAFEAWRRDPDFALNDVRYQGASIMVTRDNFGSGSSREHAVWALDGLGIECVIGESFADIFSNNCLQSGLLTVELAPEDIDDLMARVKGDPGVVLVVDLEEQTVAVGDGSWERHFDIDSFRKHRLLNGLDDISMTLELDDAIGRFEEERDPSMPSTTGGSSINVRWKS